MFAAQPSQQPIQELVLQPDFPALAGHVTAAMEQVKRIPNMPVVSEGPKLFDVLKAIQADLKKVHENVEKTMLEVHRLRGDLDDVKVTLDKVQLDGVEARRDIEQLKVNSDKMREDISQLKQNVHSIVSE